MAETGCSTDRGARKLTACQLVVPDLEQDRVHVEGSEARHLLRSLRARCGDRIEGTDGRGMRAWLEVTSVSAAAAELKVAERQRSPMPRRRWWLATRASGSRFDWLVEKAVELGAWGLIPLHTRTAARAAREGRWDRLARAALGQCRGSWGLEIEAVTDLDPLLAGSVCRRPWQALIWADPGGQAAARLRAAEMPEGDLLLVVGPPEGFSDGQREILSRWPGERCISFGPRRLRAETAALAALVWVALEGENS